MNFLTQIHALPNLAFPLIEVTNEHSLTLSIGQDCLNSCDFSLEKAISKFREHSAEIALTHLHDLLSAQPKTNHEALSEVVRLIHAIDQNY